MELSNLMDIELFQSTRPRGARRSGSIDFNY